MEEITCPQCGRPNLIEAEKCWYCQTVLERDLMTGGEGNSTVPQEKPSTADTKTKPADQMQIDQDIPDWLKRIRELKKADEPPEEEDPDWQQQNLFRPEGQSQKQKLQEKKHSSAKENTARQTPPNETSDSLPLKTEQEEPVSQSNGAELQNINEVGYQEQNPDTLSDELPDGFTKL